MAAAAARACFYARDYAGARGHLQSLGASDSKLRHNLALAEYYAAGAASPALLLAALEGLKRGEGDAEQADEGSLATYNVAVLHFQQQRYGRCRALLEALFANVEPLDEFVAFRVCLLLLEVTLLQGDVPLATQVLGYLDRSYAALTKANGAAKAGGGENGAGGADGGGAPADKGDGEGEGAEPGKAASAPPEWPNKRSSRPSPVAISPTEVKLAMHLARARLLLLLRAPQPAKRELKLALGVSSGSATALFLKAHVELLRGNARQALKLVGTLPLPASALSSSSSSASGPSSEPALAAAYYNNLGCVHHGLGKHGAAALYFERARRENDASCPQPKEGYALFRAVDARCEISFNLGINRLLAGQPLAAYSLLTSALPKLWPWATLWLRLGECCVELGRARMDERAGSDIFSEVEEDSRGSLALGASVAALGSRRVLLPASGRAFAKWHVEGMLDVEERAEAGSWPQAPAGAGWPANGKTFVTPEPTLAYALVCFRNALSLSLPGSGRKSAGAGGLPEGAGGEGGGGGAMETPDSSPAFKATAAGQGQGPLGSGLDDATQSCLHVSRLNLAWLSLYGSDPLGALSALSDLPLSKTALPAHRALALSYAADALCQVGRAQEAIALLSPSSLSSLLTRSLLDEEDPRAPSPDGLDLLSLSSPLPPSPPTLLSLPVRCLLATNMAAAHVANADLRSAEACCVQALQLQPHAREPLLLLAYLHLLNGNEADALSILRAGQAAPQMG